MRKNPRLFQLLAQAQRAVFLEAERESLAQLGLTPVQLGLLYVLEGDRPVTMAEAGRALDLSPAAVSGLADRCERAGLVARQASQRDGRSVQLVATERGRTLREKSYPLLAELNARLVEGLDETERAAVAKFLTGLVDRFGKSKGEKHD